MCFRPPVASVARQCPQCGTTNPTIADVCIKCGAELPEIEVEPMKCPRCGGEIGDEDTACPSCDLSVDLIMQADKTVRCPECKQPNSGLNDVCVRCGTHIPKPWDGEEYSVRSGIRPPAAPQAPRGSKPPSPPTAPKA